MKSEITTAGYHETRKLPERKRATRNGKRSLDSFMKSLEDRMAVEYPEWAEVMKTNIEARLLIAYFYFTKYICNRFNTEGYMVATMAMDSNYQGFYTDNILGTNNISILRPKIEALLKESLNAAL